MAKGFNVPIIHVNADDAEACSQAMRLAMAYRQQWKRDIVIDVVGYRRFGHNETDEPAYTQPLMTAAIKDHDPVSEIYTETLIEQKVVTREEVEEAAERRRAELRSTLDKLREKMDSGVYEDPTVTSVGTGELDRSASPPVQTAVKADRLKALNEALLEVPASFTIHRKLRKPLSRRTDAMENGGIEFAHAEALAFASLISDGVHVRLTGQDTERGHLLPAPPGAPRREDRPQSTRRSSTSRRRRPRSSSTTARFPRTPASASSTATPRRSPSHWCCGRPSSATSPTPGR